MVDKEMLPLAQKFMNCRLLEAGRMEQGLITLSSLTVPAPVLHSYLFYSPVSHHHLWASVSLSPIIMCSVSHVFLYPSFPFLSLQWQPVSLHFLLSHHKAFQYIPMYPFPFCGCRGSEFPICLQYFLYPQYFLYTEYFLYPQYFV